MRKQPFVSSVSIGGPTISHNTYIHRIARICVRPLVRTPVTPNQLTTARLAAGLAAAAAFAVGTDSWNYAGSGLFVLSVLLDRADGELARLGGQSSSGGHRYDLIADATCNAVAFIGIGIGQAGGALGVWSYPLGVIAGAAIAGILWMTMAIEAHSGPRAAELGTAAGFDPDDAVLVVPLVVVLGGAGPLLVVAAVAAPAFALFFHLVHRRRRLDGRGRSRS